MMDRFTGGVDKYFAACCLTKALVEKETEVKWRCVPLIERVNALQQPSQMIIGWVTQQRQGEDNLVSMGKKKSVWTFSCLMDSDFYKCQG